MSAQSDHEEQAKLLDRLLSAISACQQTLQQVAGSEAEWYAAVCRELAVAEGHARACSLSVRRAEITHRATELQLRKLSRAIEQTPLSVVITDSEGHIEYCNPAMEEISGFRAADIIGKTPRTFKSDKTPPAVHQELWRTLKEGRPWHGEILNQRASGDLFWEKEWISPVKDEAGQITHFVAVKEDITAIKRAEELLRVHDMALESSMNGILITSSMQLDHPITYVNRAFETMTGYRAEDVLGKNARFLVRDDLDQPQLIEIRHALREHREAHAVLRNYRKDGSLFWVELAIAPVRDESGSITTHFVSILNDVTDRMQYEQQLEYQATHDVLTGLANRSLLSDRVAQAIALARRNETLVAVMLLDLDRFKLINDGFGHTLADDVLRQVSTRLVASVRDTDTVARLGGDEFVIVLTDLPDHAIVEKLADKVLAHLTRPLLVEDKEIYVTASIGIALYPDDGDHGEILMRSADVAMYRVKEHGRNSYRVFRPEMGTMALERLDMEGALRRALERREFTVHYQPKVALVDDRIVGAEALVRWHQPNTGLLSPAEFIPLAEDTGLIVQLGEFVLDEVCRQLRAWLDASLPVVQIAVNISARQFREEGFAKMVADTITRHQIDPALIELEMTESMVMHQGNFTLDLLNELKQIGIRFALDDFGTGYSSLSYLKRFPIDTLKIDQSFVRDLDQDRDDAAIAKAIVVMAHSLDLHVVAEGVEREAQLAILREFGCDEYQGYLKSRPIPPENFSLLIHPVPAA